jgi:hypothetical protein
MIGFDGIAGAARARIKLYYNEPDGMKNFKIFSAPHRRRLFERAALSSAAAAAPLPSNQLGRLFALRRAAGLALVVVVAVVVVVVAHQRPERPAPATR